ncbi:phosphoribosyl-ATP diphosphatase [Planctomycetota bacterium]|nr:phosphoribosyl-ATP diphosphatase [Planctomycetota bacterium]
MIIPSIDLMRGSTVQLVGGEELAIEAGDPRPLLDRFSRVGETAVIDLDAATGEGSNEALITELCRRSPVRVGGGIRDLETARRWLDRGAAKIIIGTAASPELLRELPKERVIVALDCRDGEVVVEGWRKRTGRGVAERMAELAPFTSGFLVTFVELEGRLGGTALDRVRGLVEAAGDARVTIAGGVTRSEEVAALDAMGADAQIGMALYTGDLPLVDAFSAPLTSERSDGLIATVVTDEAGRALGMCWSSRRSLEYALENGVGAYESRRRGLWVKGATSGATQELIRIEPDCDRDALRFVVRQAGAGFCHLDTESCWGPATGLRALEQTLARRRSTAEEGSYSQRLFGDAELLGAKLREEAAELSEASGPEEVVHEAADVLYFASVAMARAGVTLSDVERELDRRAASVTRRPGNAKPEVERS